MKRLIAAPFHAACLSLAFAAASHAAEAADAPAEALRRWMPIEIQAGPQMGLEAARFRASPRYRDLVEPVPAEGGWSAPSWGAVLGARWRTGLSLSFAPRRETYGLRTREDTVSFAGNAYPHTLRSRTELAYNVYPLLAGMGWFSGRQHVQVQVGAYAATLQSADLDWTVDGAAYPGQPRTTARESISGWMLALEYGRRMGPGELVLGFEVQRAGETALDGLEGGIRPEAVQARIAYLWTLMRR